MTDPVEWLTRHIAAGIQLREECHGIRTQGALDDWCVREGAWAREAETGVAARSPRDAERVRIVDNPRPVTFQPGHPWHKPAVAYSLTPSSTGADFPGSNSLACHARRIEILREIENEWRAVLPTRPKLKDSTAPDRAAFEDWYRKRADAAQAGDRSSREDDLAAAQARFPGFRILGDWIKAERRKLPAGHPFRKKGPRAA